MNGKRILLVSSVPLAAPWNGADKNLARLLATHDLDNVYIVQSDRFEPWTGEHIKVVREEATSPLPDDRQKLRSLFYMLRQTRNADLIHVVASVRRPNPAVGPFLRTWRRISGRPLIHTAPSVGDDTVQAAYFPGDVTVVVTEYDRQRLTSAGVRQVKRIYPPLDWANQAIDPSSDDLASKLELGQRAVLYPGHYGPHGGLTECIQAFARLPSDFDDAVLVLACRTYPHQDPKTEARHARDLANDAGVGERTRVVGQVENLKALIAACALTALVPSRLEGKMAIPMVLLESLALERPIITGSEPPLSEALFSGGLAVQPGDPQALASAMAELLSDPELRRQLGGKGRENVRRECTLTRTVHEYHELYRRLLDDAI